MNQLCSLGFNGNELVALLFSLPLEFDLESLLPVGVSGSPDGFVIFDLIFDDSVKDDCDFVRGRGGGGSGTELSFHSAQVVAQGGGAMMKGKGCQAKEVAGAIFHCSYAPPQEFPTADVIVRTESGNKVCCGGPLGHVSADLTEQW